MTLITITQNFGGDGTAIARKVADGLGVELFDDRKLQGLVQVRGIPSRRSAASMKRRPGSWTTSWAAGPRCFWTFSNR